MNAFKHWTAIILLMGLTMPLNAQKTLNQEITDDKGDKKLVGQCSRSGLQAQPYNEWFSKYYADYTPDAQLIKKSKKKFKNVKVEIFMGTWCGDSKRGVPQFYKVLDALGVDEANVSLINVDNVGEQYKKSPTGEEKGKFIHRVPTFIFYEGDEEVGRIVETPVTSFEMDIAQIMYGLPSAPNYKAVPMLHNILTARDTVPSSRKDLLEIARQVQFARKNEGELNNYGYLLMNQGEIDKAIAVFIINTMLYATVPNVYDSLGEAYEKAKDYRQALEMYEKVLELSPKDENARKKVNELKVKLG